MTDLEITRLCAEAMGHRILGALADGTGYAVNREEAYRPLHDDAQAMALVKVKRLIVSPTAKLCKEVGIKGLTFHDLRRTAIVRLAKKLTPFELAKMVGHKDLRMTLNVYYKQDAEATAEKLG